MSDQSPEILEDFEPLLNLKKALECGDRKRFDRLLCEISAELVDDYRTQIKDKVCRWATATVVPRFYKSPLFLPTFKQKCFIEMASMTQPSWSPNQSPR